MVSAGRACSSEATIRNWLARLRSNDLFYERKSRKKSSPDPAINSSFLTASPVSAWNLFFCQSAVTAVTAFSSLRLARLVSRLLVILLTMVLSEPLGLQLLLIIRGGILLGLALSVLQVVLILSLFVRLSSFSTLALPRLISL